MGRCHLPQGQEGGSVRRSRLGAPEGQGSLKASWWRGQGEEAFVEGQWLAKATEGGLARMQPGGEEPP